VPFPQFSPLRLVTDRYLSEGVGQGAIGFILEVYDDGYEVEFSRPDGTTIAWFSVEPGDIEPAPEAMYQSSQSASV